MALNDQVLLRLGGAIREYRLKADFSQQSLADKAGVSRSSVRRLESGEGGDISTLLNVLRGLGRLEDMDKILPKIPMRPTEVMKLRRKEAAKHKKRASRRPTREINSVTTKGHGRHLAFKDNKLDWGEPEKVKEKDKS